MTELPRGEPLELPASLVCTSTAPVRVVPVTIRRFDGSSYEVEAPEDAVEPGVDVVLDLASQDLPIVRARTGTWQDGRLRLEVVTSQERDHREFPRMAAGIHMRYRCMPASVTDAACASWMAGGAEPEAETAWREPDPLMDFSASGLAFEDSQSCDSGDRLLIELGHPDGAGSWRGLGRVVRAEQQIDPAWHIAVTLEGLPAEAVQALLEYTVELQERASGESAD